MNDSLRFFHLSTATCLGSFDKKGKIIPRIGETVYFGIGKGNISYEVVMVEHHLFKSQDKKDEFQIACVYVK